MELTLLERLARPEESSGRSVHENTARLAESVLANLKRLLNSRHGHALIQPDYGIPEISEFVYSMPESLAEMRRALKSTIEKYEPRLRNVQVKHVASEDVFLLRFEITAELVTAREKASVWLETLIESSGQVEVRG